MSQSYKPSGWCLGLMLFATLSVQAQTLAVPGAGFPVDVLVKSPALTNTDLQVICLFQADPANTLPNTLHGSLAEIDEKLGGLLSQLRKESLFGGQLGETLLVTPRPGTIPARRLLLIGLGDLPSFTPAREQVVGFVVFEEAERLAISHPFFAPTVLDGGKTGVETGDVAQQFMAGFLRAKASHDLLQQAGVSSGKNPNSLTFLAGGTHAEGTRDGLARAFQTAPHR